MKKDIKVFIASITISIGFFALGAFYDVIEDSAFKAHAALTRPYTYVAGAKILSAELNLDFNTLYNAIGTQTYTQKNQIANDQTTTASLDAIDIAIGTLHYSGTSIVTSDQTITASILALDTKFGDWEFTGSNYIATTDNLTSALDKLDMQVKDNSDFISSNSLTPKYFKQNLKIAPPGESGVTSANCKTHVAITADELILTNLSNQSYIDSGVSITAAITTAGENGLETGTTESGTTLYYIWVCRYYSGTTSFALFSSSGTTPLAIPNNTYKRLVGEIYNNSSSNFLLATRYDDRVKLWEPLTIYSNQTLQPWYLTITLPSPLALIEWTSFDYLTTQTSSGRNERVVLSGTTNPANPLIAVQTYDAINSNYFGLGYSPTVGTMPRIGSKSTIYVRVNNNTSATGNNMQILGYTLPR